ncbi:hypothetical protein [Umezawaea tangerina]|uniref:Uncharacterized protein n=1 Tax=Umezawaea tangerina TaxID=84725 RepID=A0A2T0T2J2_9PSEU|nr:hypothetical protein [Umezawaea tangerina]PRY39853.1 hypothetical protein CLV43_107440 [Umezawaea tangerina]
MCHADLPVTAPADGLVQSEVDGAPRPDPAGFPGWSGRPVPDDLPGAAALFPGFAPRGGDR